mmetsp:Transcript_52749/g.150323  ORF Transcript_52749/g.150323 Transcript_52749/m.150323 type:complete len:204 (+) Transcript_52749:450-1061(+)
MAVREVACPVLGLFVRHRCLSGHDEELASGARHLGLGLGVRQLQLHALLRQALGLLRQPRAQLARHSEPHAREAEGLRRQAGRAEVLRHLHAQVLGVGRAEVGHPLAQGLRHRRQVLAEELALAIVLVDLPLLVVDEEGSALLRALALVLVEVLVRVFAAVFKAIGAEAALAASTGNGTAIVIVEECLLAPWTFQRENVVNDP